MVGAITQTKLPQQEFKQFLRRVAFLKEEHNITIDYQVSKRNKRKVKVVLFGIYDWERLDELCEGM